MKGKIAFVLGAAVGYVLGTRAGRERYEQIKRGAQSLWNTAPVQRGVGAVRDAAQLRVDELKAAAVRTGKNVVGSLLHASDDARPSAASGAAASGSERPASGARASGGAGAAARAGGAAAEQDGTPGGEGA
ncbi:YtxH domain-containing protein [Leucobacter allii]|uniref:YtxH domain-containing protein n=1 Tax=Leucobacter allii TaxID=2932247 RepID=UPI001FD3F246|nr:YtxH domain-containing protein [Leucobacter allii]UOR01712.1 YtxH domain-containing protein [Leucobacter allii]